MKYPFTLLVASFLPVMAILDYAYDKYNSLSMIIIILSGIIIICMRKQVIGLEKDALVSGEKDE